MDPLGYQLQLHQDIKAGKREMTYRVLDGDSIDTDRFAVINGGKMNTGSQQRATLKAEKVREDSKRQTLMWFAPEQDYLLVRLRQVEPDGSEYELKLREAKFGPLERLRPASAPDGLDLIRDDPQALRHPVIVLGVGHPQAFVAVLPAIFRQPGEEIVTGDHQDTPALSAADTAPDW